MVTRQSIMNADLDSLTTDWIEAQLSSAHGSWGEMRSSRLSDGLQGMVYRLALEVREVTE